MFDATNLWKQRLKLYINELRKYGRYIFNDHLKLVLFIGLGFGAYFYQKWLSTLNDDFPASIVIAIVLGLFLATGSVHTLLKGGDIVFLLPVEEKLRSYFQRAFVFSYLVSLISLLLGIVLIIPLYWHFYHFSSVTSWLLFLGLVVVKGWNLYLSHSFLYLKESMLGSFDFIIRFVCMASLVYFTLQLAFVGITITIGVMIVYAIFLLAGMKGKLFKWEKGIENDVKKIQLFYRVANMFTDIPHLKQTVKRRKMLDVFATKGDFKQRNVYHYLFSRTFLRSSDYLGLYIRLLAIGAVGMFIIPLTYTEVFVSLFFLYLIGFQLMPMWKHHDSLLWLHIYPISEGEKQKAFTRLMMLLLGIGAIIFAIISLFSSGKIIVSLLVLLVGIGFSLLFARYYMPTRMKEEI
ncbi:MAG: ABC transporter permease [Bacillaceae bacterium]